MSIKRLRLQKWSGTLLSPRTRPCCLQQLQIQQHLANIRPQSTATSPDLIFEDRETLSDQSSSRSRTQFTPPSPPLAAALQSAKLSALHARLSLPKSLPLQTLARTLVDATADSNPNFNNSSLAHVGGKLISLHIGEYLLCKCPRLPMAVLYAAAFAFCGPKTLYIIGKELGVETAAAPGPEIDPGLLQFAKVKPKTQVMAGTVRGDKPNYRRGMSSRVVYDDEFGDTLPKPEDERALEQTTEKAYAQFVRALTGAIFLHAGREDVKSFVRDHLLSRHLKIEDMFKFWQPVRDLSRLCAREDFDYPVARILSETGRKSRTPVFVVGIFSGEDKLGEGAGPSLDEARMRAAAAALKAWYMYSPGNDVRVPSDMEGPDPQPWRPVHIDIGEIVG